MYSNARKLLPKMCLIKFLNCSDGVTFFCFSLCNWQHTMLPISFYPGHRCECHVSVSKNPDSVFAKLLWNTKITSLETNTHELAYNETALKQTKIVCFGVDLFMVQGRFCVTCYHARGGGGILETDLWF